MANKSLKKQLNNLFLFLVLVAVGGFIVNYYSSYWSSAHAQESSSNIEFELPKNHPDINSLQEKFPAEGEYCLSCHQGIEPTRPLASEMMIQILAKGEAMGDPNGCVVCHGGTPSEKVNKTTAHSGAPKESPLKTFTPVPGALQINEYTCGLCHDDHTYNVHRSNMNTDAGKMKAIAWSWGIDTEDYNHRYGDHDIIDTDGNTPRFGSDTYKAYMKEMAEAFPGQFPTELKQIPEVDLSKLQEMPEQAAFTYLRNCNACHLSNKGYQDRGHYRGMGCAACHTLYSNEGYYEGGDPSIDTEQTGHLMVHAMQGSRNSKIVLNGKEFSGIQVSTCAACHAAGRRIGHAYQGLMALGHGDNRGPFDENAMPQPANAGYVFKYMKDDVHHSLNDIHGNKSGMLCQDCHTTNSIHGNGNMGATTLATIEIECADCHGTPEYYPWELPIGYGDEFGKKLDFNKPRGLADEPMEVSKKFGKTYEKEDGYLITARGNAFGNVVRRGDKVIVHSANGHDFELSTLKETALKNEWSNPAKAKTAMVSVKKHMEKLECYACHSTWAAQYYGFKHAIDYTKQSIDWLNSAEKVEADGTTADRNGNYVMQAGAPTAWDYSHVRWENPPLGINGEGRVTPLVGVIQTVGTVIDPAGKTIIWNNVAQTEEGYNAIEMAPLHPHTSSKESRECADCHGNKAAIGYGIDGGRYDAEPNIQRFADVVTASGENVSKHTRVQIEAIQRLHGDFMQIIRESGEQVQTVDSHWPTSMPLTLEQRNALSRDNTCLACHQDIPNGSIPMTMLGKIADIVDLEYVTDTDHGQLLRQNNIWISWVKALGIIALVLMIPFIIICVVKRNKIKEIWNRLKG